MNLIEFYVLIKDILQRIKEKKIEDKFTIAKV